MTAKGYVVSFGGDENILKLIALIVIQSGEHTKKHLIVHIN